MRTCIYTFIQFLKIHRININDILQNFSSDYDHRIIHDWISYQCYDSFLNRIHYSLIGEKLKYKYFLDSQLLTFVFHKKICFFLKYWKIHFFSSKIKIKIGQLISVYINITLIWREAKIRSPQVILMLAELILESTCFYKFNWCKHFFLIFAKNYFFLNNL